MGLRWLYVVAALTAVAAVFFAFRGGEKDGPPTFRAIDAMSTRAEITLPDGGDEAVFGAGLDAIREVERLCSIFDEDSELSRLNRAAFAAPFACSPELYAILKEAREAFVLSGARFDVTAAPLMKLWGFRRRAGEPSLPAPEETAAAIGLVGLEKVAFDDAGGSVSFRLDGVSIDLGGIAKGYAADLAAKRIRDSGYTGRGMVNVGGNLRMLDPVKGTPGGGFRVGIRNPLKRGEVCGSFRLYGGAVATSGNYERFVTIGGKRYAHIMNPLTGQPVEGILAVTAVAENAMRADWLSTAVFIGGAALAEKLADALPDAEFYLFFPSELSPDGFTVIHVGSSCLTGE